MLYRNGREARIGDMYLKLNRSGHVIALGTLQRLDDVVSLADCIHVDDAIVSSITYPAGSQIHPAWNQPCYT